MGNHEKTNVEGSRTRQGPGIAVTVGEDGGVKSKGGGRSRELNFHDKKVAKVRQRRHACEQSSENEAPREGEQKRGGEARQREEERRAGQAENGCGEPAGLGWTFWRKAERDEIAG